MPRILTFIKLFTSAGLAVSLVVLFPALSRAVTFELNSGQIIKGEIVQQDADSFKLDTGIGFPVTYFIDEIKFIDGKPVSPANGSKVKEQAGESVKEMENVGPPPPAAETIPKIKVEPESGPKRKPEPAPKVEIKPNSEVEPAGEIQEAISAEDRQDIINLDEVIMEDIKPAEELPPMKDVVSKEVHQMMINNKAVETGPKPGLMDGPRLPYPETPVKDISVIEVSEPSKEHPSPFGPTIKPRNEPSGVPNAGEPRESDLAAKKVEELKTAGQDNQRIQVAQTRLQKKMQFIIKKLQQLPLRVRRDILKVLTFLLGTLYVFICYPLMIIARKMGKKHSWLIWVPVAQMVYYFHMAGKPLWWSLGLLVPVVNCLILLVLFLDILKALSRPLWVVILMIIPGVNILVLWYLALTQKLEAKE